MWGEMLNLKMAVKCQLVGYGFCGFGQFSLRKLDSKDDKKELSQVHKVKDGKGANILTLSSIPQKLIVSSAWDALFIYVKESEYSNSYCSEKWYESLSKLTQELCHSSNEMISHVYEINDNKLYIQTTNANGFVIDVTSYHTHKITNVICYWKFANKESFCVTSNGKLHRTKDNFVPIGNSILGDTIIASVANGTDHAVLLTNNGVLYSFGLGTRGQLGTGQLLPVDKPQIIEALQGIPIRKIASGYWHTLALSEYGDIYSWGWNEHNQLGHSNQQIIVPQPTLVEGISSDVVISTISCGSRHSCGVSNDGVCYVWGWNGYKQIPNTEEETIKCPIRIEPVIDVICAYWCTLVVIALS